MTSSDPLRSAVSSQLGVLLNHLILAASAKGYQQDRPGIADEDRITDADIEKIEAQILALASASASPRPEWPVCANCQHTAPHTRSTAGGGPHDPYDGCTHPDCHCGYWSEAPAASASPQATEVTRDDLRAASHACEAQGNIHDLKQSEEEGIATVNSTRGREWHALATKLSAAAYSASPQAKGEDWQPIETAPKDGTKILIYDKAWCHGNPKIDVSYWQPYKHFDGSTWAEHGSWSGITFPTHWQPLPLPPSARPASLEEPQQPKT